MWSRPEVVRLGEGSEEYVENLRVGENTLEQSLSLKFEQLGDVQGVLCTVSTSFALPYERIHPQHICSSTKSSPGYAAVEELG